MFLKLSEYRNGRLAIDDTYSIAIDEERNNDGSILGYHVGILDDTPRIVENEFIDYDMIEMDNVIRFDDDECDYKVIFTAIFEDELVQGFRISVETN